MARVATITVSMKDKSYTDTFPIEDHVKEYQVADEAYRLGLIFADTQIIARFGRRISSSEFADALRELDYTYEIKEVE